MSTATNGAATEAAFKVITRATRDAGPARVADASTATRVIELAQSDTEPVSTLAATHSDAARALLRK